MTTGILKDIKKRAKIASSPIAFASLAWKSQYFLYEKYIFNFKKKLENVSHHLLLFLTVSVHLVDMTWIIHTFSRHEIHSKSNHLQMGTLKKRASRIHWPHRLSDGVRLNFFIILSTIKRLINLTFLFIFESTVTYNPTSDRHQEGSDS
jgi:hypothetical protein